MQTLSVIAVALVTAGASSYAFSVFAPPSAEPPAPASAELEAQVADLQRQHSELLQRVEDLVVATEARVARREVPAESVAPLDARARSRVRWPMLRAASKTSPTSRPRGRNSARAT